MQTVNYNAIGSELLTFHGDVGAADFPEWIAHRANRLGLTGWVRADAGGERVEVMVSGPADLIDAMELGCSLGPISVWVEQIDRVAANEDRSGDVGFVIVGSAQNQ